MNPQLLRPTPGVTESVPYTIAGLLARWCADDLRATLADAAAVSSWTDASGNGNTISNTLTNRPTFDAVNPQLNDHASVHFVKGSSQYLFGSSIPICTALSGTDVPFEVYVVCVRSTKVTAIEDLVSLGNNATGSHSYMAMGWNYASNTSQRPYVRVNDDDTGRAQTLMNGLPNIDDMGPKVMVWSMTGAAAAQYAVGVSRNPLYDATVQNLASTDYSAHTAFTFDRFAIGAILRNAAAQPCDVDVAEVLVYNRALSQAERSRLCEHLTNKYFVRTITSPTQIPGCVGWWDASQLAGSAGADVTAFNDLVGTKHFEATGFDPPVVALHENGNKVLSFTAASSQALDTAGATDGNFLHNGSNYGLFVVYRASAAALTPILTTMGDSATARGFTMAHDGASGAHSLQVKIGNGSTNVINQDSQDYGSRPGVWHVAHISHEAMSTDDENFVDEEYHIWLDNERYVAVDDSNDEDTGNAAGTLTLGQFVGGAHGTVEIAEIIVYNRKLGRPWESQLVNQYLARKWHTSHVALVAGNGIPQTLLAATSHRGFPSMCQDANGAWHVIYRRGTDHGGSRGVLCHCTSADGIRWSPERVIYDVDDNDGRDARGEGGLICLQNGPHAGRLVKSTNWQADDSSLHVGGNNLLIGYSDDRGGSWTWIDPCANDPTVGTWGYAASPDGFIELQTGPVPGRILLSFAMNDTDSAPSVGSQDLRVTWSDDGGETWSASVVITEHDAVPPDGIGINMRATETDIIEFADGELLMSIRNETDKEVWFAHATTADLTAWTVDGSAGFTGYGRPVMAIDPNDPDAVFWFGRSHPGLLSVWRYSDDRGATWGDEHIFSNMHTVVGVLDYPTMTYHHPSFDADGNLWVVFGLEDQSTDSDVFFRRWENVA